MLVFGALDTTARLRRLNRITVIYGAILLSIMITLNFSGSILRNSVNLEKSDFKIALVQSNIPEVSKWEPDRRFENLKVHLNLIEEASKHKPALAIWPESSVSPP